MQEGFDADGRNEKKIIFGEIVGDSFRWPVVTFDHGNRGIIDIKIETQRRKRANFLRNPDLSLRWESFHFAIREVHGNGVRGEVANFSHSFLLFSPWGLKVRKRCTFRIHCTRTVPAYSAPAF